MNIFSAWPICRVLPVTQESDVGTVRRACLELSEVAGFSELDTGRLALIATELATNLAKHAKNGQMILQMLGSKPNDGVAIVAIDHGPGMYDVESCLIDGFSTAGSPGTGMGAVKRQADLFDIYSEPGVGSIMTTEVYPNRESTPDSSQNIRCLCRPLASETVSGDAWGYLQQGSRTALTIIDGLGHGPGAAEASHEGLRVFLESDPGDSPTQMLRRMSGSMRRTRGAACAIATIDLDSNTIFFAGVGNINASFRTVEKENHLVSMPGTLGVGDPKIKEFQHPYLPQSLLAMSSDGLQTRQTLPYNSYRSSPLTVAAYLLQKFQRHNDDSTILVARI